MAVNINLRNSVGGKLLVIVILALGLLIPASMIKGLVREREGTKDMVIKEIGSKWGRAQTIGGPILSVPYMKRYTDEKGKERSVKRFAYFLPKTLNIKSIVRPEIRYRSIYQTVLYDSEVLLEGEFLAPDFQELCIADDSILWDRARISVDISDLRGIKEGVAIHFNSKPLQVQPASDNGGIISSGISSNIPRLNNTEGFKFAVSINLRGSEHLMFLPMGKTTTADMSSNWASPSFAGQYLPMEREMDENGFRASWSVLQLNRAYPQSWTNETYDFRSSAFGTRFIIPADGYQKTMRMTKYAILFIFIAFVSFFLMEVLGKKNIHPVQYSLIGTSLVVFYSLLLAITEHAGFTVAYTIASSMLILMVTTYTWSFLSSARLAGVAASVLAALYGFMFIVLQAEDYALLGGSLGIFVMIGLAMYVTRNVNWYALEGFNSVKKNGN